MIDTQRIKNRIDCRDLIAHDLGKPKVRNNKYATFRCPLHHEEKGFSLVVYADHWHCFGKCGHGGDAIAWVQEYHGLDFREACERLSSGDLPQTQRVHIPKPSAPPGADWQMSARKIADIAQETLWSPSGTRALDYLHARGLTEQTIRDAHLGVVPGGYTEWKRIAGLNVPCGITIPWLADGQLWGIKVRRSAGEPRYQQIAGGDIAGSLYLADGIRPGTPILLTEGEFDALIVRQVAGDLVSAVSIGSAANRSIHPHWLAKFLSAPSLLIRMDDDQAGLGAAEQLLRLSQAARCVQVPHGKDVNEFLLHAGEDALRKWIAESIARRMTRSR